MGGGFMLRVVTTNSISSSGGRPAEAGNAMNSSYHRLLRRWTEM